MADLASMTQLGITGTPDSNAKWGGIVCIQGTFPITSATATCPIGDLTANDIVLVQAVQAKAGNTVPYAEILASRTTGAQGIVTIGTQDGSNTAATQIIRVTKYKL